MKTYMQNDCFALFNAYKELTNKYNVDFEHNEFEDKFEYEKQKNLYLENELDTMKDLCHMYSEDKDKMEKMLEKIKIENENLK